MPLAWPVSPLTRQCWPTFLTKFPEDSSGAMIVEGVAVGNYRPSCDRAVSLSPAGSPLPGVTGAAERSASIFAIKSCGQNGFFKSFRPEESTPKSSSAFSW